MPPSTATKGRSKMTAVFIARLNGQTFTRTSRKRDYKYALLARLSFQHALEQIARDFTEERFAELWAYHERHASRVPSADGVSRGEHMVEMSAHLAAKDMLERHGNLEAFVQFLKATELDLVKEQSAKGYYDKFHVLRWSAKAESIQPKPFELARWTECVVVPVERVEKVARRSL